MGSQVDRGAEETRGLKRSAAPLGGQRQASGPAGAVLSPCGGPDGQHIFSSSACRCNGLTVSSIKASALIQWTAANGCSSHWTCYFATQVVSFPSLFAAAG